MLWFKEPSRIRRISTHHSSLYHPLLQTWCCITGWLHSRMVSPGTRMQRKCHTKVMQHQSASLRWMLNFNGVPHLKKKKRRGSQNKKVHLNVFGTCCMFGGAASGWPQCWEYKQGGRLCKAGCVHCLFHSPTWKYKGREGINLTDSMAEGKVCLYLMVYL